MLRRHHLAGAVLVATLGTACGAGDLKVLHNPRVVGSLSGFQITYDGSDDPSRCVGTNPSISADEDGQAMTYEDGRVVDQCDAEGPAETCGHSHPACLTPVFTLTGSVDDSASTTIHVHDSADDWTITVPRGGTVEFDGAPSDGGPITVGDALSVHCAPTSGQVIGAYLAFTEAGAEQKVATTDGGIDGGVVSFTIASDQLLDGEVRDVQVVCNIAFAPTVCSGPASCELTGPLRGASVPMLFPQL
ncbi:MAG: hypothetical protein JST54_32775 [Deltaproteobacteria bacterium]|nr:hypothetical protein [Deltaproteobacteria bacterium]